MRQRQEGEDAADLGNKEMRRGTIGNRGNCVGNGSMWEKIMQGELQSGTDVGQDHRSHTLVEERRPHW